MATAPLLATLLALAVIASPAQARSPVTAPELPALPASAWLNSEPLTLEVLRGRPVLIEFWTFGCSNCRNTLPWLEHVQRRYGPRGLAIIAIHSPEFDFERDPTAVAANVGKLGIDYPVLIDNDFRYWKALDNRYWPAFYLIGPDGRIAATRIGELHRGQRSADEFERAIADML